MSKFKIIEGSNVVSISDASRNLKLLEMEVNRKVDPSNKELMVFAYNFLKFGQPLSAQKQLSRLSSGYFDMMIYKDLFQAMLGWSIIKGGRVERNSEAHKQYEFFLITRHSLELFEPLNFPEKPAFFRFRREFQRFTQSLTGL